MALDKNLLAAVKAGFKKQAFVPAGGDPAAGGMPPGGDPAAAGGGMPVDPATGMPIDPATGMPMDPSMMMGGGGGMPMDPSMMMAGGGMPPPAPAPAPEGDPAAGGMPPAGGEEMSPEGEPYIKMTMSQLLATIEKILKLTQKIGNGGQALAQNGGAQGGDNQQLVSEIRNLTTALTAGMRG